MDNNNQSTPNNPNPPAPIGSEPVDPTATPGTDLNTPVATQVSATEPSASDMLNQTTAPDWNSLQTSVDVMSADTFTPNFDPNQPYTPQATTDFNFHPSTPTENPTAPATPAQVGTDQPAATPTWPPTPIHPDQIGIQSGQVESIPTQTPPPVDNNAAVQSVISTLQGQTLQETPPPAEEPAPTDLSQLSASSPTGVPATVYTPPVSSDNLVVNQKPTPEVAGTTQNKIPLKLIIAGVLVLLLVTAASVYFLFFTNNTTLETSSLPAETQDQTPLTNPPNQLAQNALTPGGTEAPATPAAQIQPSPEATSGATQTFGSLNGKSSSPSASPTSALELLRQRQKSSQ